MISSTYFYLHQLLCKFYVILFNYYNFYVIILILIIFMIL